jgi:phosphinothricin acetyltransferase
LLEALLAIVRDEGIHRVLAGVALPNPASIRLHEGLGFRRVAYFAEVGTKFGRYWDVAWYEKAL